MYAYFDEVEGEWSSNYIQKEGEETPSHRN